MKEKTKLSHRLLSLLLCVALLAAYLPTASFAAEGTAVYDTKVADPSTMDDWKNFFPIEGTIHTENAGGVWTDKSVFADDTAFRQYGITQDDPNSFLVALSAMASNMTVTGMSNTPTDTMLILDLSSSMYNGYSRDPGTVQTMLTSVNSTIKTLQNLNRHNRVGVVIYYGGPDRNQSDASNSKVLLPLGRYSGTEEFLVAVLSGGDLQSVKVNAGVKDANGNSMPEATHTVANVAGTYAQLGILDAMNQLLAADTTVPATASYQPGAARVPVLVFMSDGEPTAATHDFTKKTDAGMGNNTVSIRSPNESDFVTQLTAAYAREMVDAHYEATEPLFYTLSLGSSVSLAVMDPEYHTSTVIDGYWSSLLTNGSVNITVYNSPDGWSAPSVEKTYTVRTASVNGAAFPSDKLQRNYVDQAFTAATAGNLTDVFANIVNEINLQSQYFPTHVQGSEHMSGYVSFLDKIGQHMNVTDIKGILINGGTWFSGADLASNFVPGGGALGTHDAPSELGNELVHAVMARIGITDINEARALITMAYNHGQLRYTSSEDYSNYIGWYANAAGEFLGFWHEGITTMPAPTGDAATDPAYIMKSYGYLGAVNAHAKSDMMYATVQLREDIATGEQTILFAVPAALIPTVSYAVSLDEKGAMKDLTVSGATAPIRLVYEVALDPAINAYTVRDLVSEDYLAANTAADGSVYFYTNQFEADHTVGKDAVNTYSYFRPSRDNDRYYYQEDSLIYTDTAGTLYRGTTRPTGTVYHGYTVYFKTGTALEETVVYHVLTTEAVDTARKTADDTTWYIPAGDVRRDYAGYIAAKTANPTDTLPDYAVPFTDIHGHSVDDVDHNFVVGATLGNNGRVSLKPATGIALTKIMAPDATAPTSAFRFTVTNLTDTADDTAYPARILHADGSWSETAVQFAQGQAKVALNAGETFYIGDMTPGTKLSITEEETLAYVADAATQEVTVAAGQLLTVTFVNADRGSGNLTISKEVIHSLGAGHVIPENLEFTIHVQLTGIGTANATFDAVYTDGTTGTVTTDETGAFTLTLGHDQQITLLKLPVGTVAAVTEPDPGTGFAPTYWEGQQEGDGMVTVADGTTVSVLVVNTYTTREVQPVNVRLEGTKIFEENWNGNTFQFQLQKWTADGWITIAEAAATEAEPVFDFDAAMEAERFTVPGDYYYQVIETNGGQTINGITYDATIHTFGVFVRDADMDGQLEIANVISYHTGTNFTQNADGDWQISIQFQNHYNATGCSVSLDVRKALVNPSGSPLVSLAGYRFGLYDATGSLVAASELTDGVGEARLQIHYEFEDVGTHTYTLKEIVPDTPIPGMTYDDTAYTVVVEVKDNGDGTTSAAIVSINGSTEFEAPLFTNIYRTAEVELPIDFVNKVLTGRAQKAGEFTFELRDLDGNPILTGTNGADGKVTFDGVLRYTTVGTWYYTIVETGTNGNGVTLDTQVYELMVTVTDQGGALQAQYSILNAVGNTVTFENTYVASPTEYILSGTKVLTGRALLNEEFTFLLTQTDEQGNALVDGFRAETKNFTDGSFTFPAVPFDRAGTYYFAVSEQIGSDAYGIQYDTTHYLAAITVTDNGKGALEVTEVTIRILGGSQVEAIRFENTYSPDPTAAQIPGTKVLEGQVLGSGDFAFELYSADENWNPGALLETVQNSADGSFGFRSIPFTTTGTWYYLVKEAHGGETIDGIAYDTTVYRVRIDVIDDLQGQLHAQVHIYDETGAKRDGVVFVNRYQITGEAAVTIGGTKVLTGQDLTDGQFTFELYDENGNVIQTATNQAGAFAFHLQYGPKDAGHTYRYTVKEKNGGAVIDGITYDDAVFEVTVEVTDDGKGGIVAEATIIGGPIQFHNHYEVGGEAAVTIGGTKVLIGRALEDGEFQFELYDDQGNLVGTADNGADGSFRFAALTFTEAGTYRYTVVEKAGALDNVTYDTARFAVEITVTDNGIGGLDAAIMALYKTTDEAHPAEEILFQNVYISDPDPLTLEILARKTVKNLGLEHIGPEGFQFLLENVTLGTSQTAVSDAEGLARFALVFTEADVGKTYTYKLSEINDGRANVEYSTAVYNIAITISLGEDNTLIATIVNNGAEVSAAEGAFENVHQDGPPKTGDNLLSRLMLLVLSAGAILSLTGSLRKKEND